MLLAFYFVLVHSSAHSCPSCMSRILHTLRVRYTLDMIYTYSGNILIAVGILNAKGGSLDYLNGRPIQKSLWYCPQD